MGDNNNSNGGGGDGDGRRSTPKKRSHHGHGGGGPMTLGDMNRRDANDDKDNEYYAGGSASGMAVQDPNTSRSKRVEGLFEELKKHGAVQGTAEDLHGPPATNTTGTTTKAFSGSARTLAGGTGPSSNSNTNDAATQQDEKEDKEPEHVRHVIHFWNDGFSVNDGPLRKLEDPANRYFLDAINRGQCPKELAPSDPRVPIDINLIKESTDYVEPPKPKYTAFSGSGRTLAGPSSASTSAAQTATPTSATPSSFELDEGAPMTRIQIRLANGQRLVQRFNNSHTVGHVRAFINLSVGSGPAYNLKTAPPMPKTLEDNDVTLEAAGLLGSVIIQQLC